MSSFHRVCSTEVLVSGEYCSLSFSLLPDFVPCCSSVHVHVLPLGFFLLLDFVAFASRWEAKRAFDYLHVSWKLIFQLQVKMFFFFRVHGRSFMIWSRQCKSRNPDRVWSCTWLLWKSDFNHFWYLFIKETKLQVFSLQMGQNTDVEIKNFICFVTSAALNCTFPFSTPCGYMHVNL